MIREAAGWTRPTASLQRGIRHFSVSSLGNHNGELAEGVEEQLPELRGVWACKEGCVTVNNVYTRPPPETPSWRLERIQPTRPLPVMIHRLLIFIHYVVVCARDFMSRMEKEKHTSLLFAFLSK